MLTLPAFTRHPESNHIYNVDAISLLRAMPDASVDLIATDPPYGLGGRDFKVDREMRKTDGILRHGTYTAINQEWDLFAPIDWMGECGRVLKPGGSIVICAGMKSVYEFAAEGFRLGWKLVNDITWVKINPAPNFTGRAMTYATERVLWFCPEGKGWTYNNAYARAVNAGVNFQDVWYFDSPRGEIRIHESQKPLEMFERIIELFCPVEGAVLDCFMGGGTCGIAALNTGRRFYGADITLKHVTGARNRLNAWNGAGRLVADEVTQMGLFA